MIIKFEPHSFIVFMTLAMGFSYSLLNTRAGLGFFKLLAILLVVAPFAYMGIVRGHIVDISLGALIGLLYFKGGVNFPSFSLFSWVSSLLSIFRRKSRAEHSSHDGTKQGGSQNDESAREEEIRKRRRQSKSWRQEQTQSQDQEPSSKYSRDNNSGKSESTESESQSRNNQSKSNQEKIDRENKKPKRDTRTPYQILGLSENATPEQIKKAYKLLSNRYHPDKYAHMSEEFRLEAAEEFKKVQDAWKKIS